MDDHPVLGAERASGLQLRQPFDLDEAHPAGTDGRPQPGLVAEDRDLDARGRGRLHEAGALRHPHLAVVDRDRDELGTTLPFPCSRGNHLTRVGMSVHGDGREHVVE